MRNLAFKYESGYHKKTQTIRIFEEQSMIVSMHTEKLKHSSMLICIFMVSMHPYKLVL